MEKARLRSDPDKDAAKRRRERALRAERAAQARRDVLAEVRLRFVGMLKEPATPAERQRCGYDFERLLVDLFGVADIAYRPPYTAAHEQIDGSFNFRGFTISSRRSGTARPRASVIW